MDFFNMDNASLAQTKTSSAGYYPYNMEIGDKINPFNMELLVSKITATDTLVREFKAKCNESEEYQQSLKSVNELAGRFRELYEVELKRNKELCIERDQLQTQVSDIKEKLERLQNEQINRETLFEQSMAELEIRIDKKENKSHNDYINLAKLFVEQAQILYKHNLQTITLKRKCLQMREYLKSVGEAVSWNNVRRDKKTTEGSESKSLATIGTMTDLQLNPKPFVCHKGTSIDRLVNVTSASTMTETEDVIEQLPSMFELPEDNIEYNPLESNITAIPPTINLSANQTTLPTYCDQETITRICNVRKDVNYVSLDKQFREDGNDLLGYVKKEDTGLAFNETMSNLLLPNQLTCTNINKQLLRTWQVLGETLFTIIGNGNIFENDIEGFDDERNRSLHDMIMAKLFLNCKQTTDDSYRLNRKRKISPESQDDCSDDECNLVSRKIPRNNLQMSNEPTETGFDVNTDIDIDTFENIAPINQQVEVENEIESNTLNQNDSNKQKIYFGYQPNALPSPKTINLSKRKKHRKSTISSSKHSKQPDTVSNVLKIFSRQKNLTIYKNSHAFQSELELDKGIRSAKEKQSFRSVHTEENDQTIDIDCSDSVSTKNPAMNVLDPHKLPKKKTRKKSVRNNSVAKEKQVVDTTPSTPTPKLRSLPLIDDFGDLQLNAEIVEPKEQQPNNLTDTGNREVQASSPLTDTENNLNGFLVTKEVKSASTSEIEECRDVHVSNKVLNRSIELSVSVKNNYSVPNRNEIPYSTNSLQIQPQFKKKKNKFVKTTNLKRRKGKRNSIKTLFGDSSGEESDVSSIIPTLGDSDGSLTASSEEEEDGSMAAAETNRTIRLSISSTSSSSSSVFADRVSQVSQNLAEPVQGSILSNNLENTAISYDMPALVDEELSRDTVKIAEVSNFPESEMLMENSSNERNSITENILSDNEQSQGNALTQLEVETYASYSAASMSQTDSYENNVADNLQCDSVLSTSTVEYINYSPASPRCEDRFSTEVPKIIPLSVFDDKIADVSESSSDFNDSSHSILDRLIKSYSPQCHNKISNSSHILKTGTEIVLIKNIRDVIENYLVATECSTAELTDCIQKILTLTKRPKYLCIALLEIIEDTTEPLNMACTPPAPALSTSHQKCLLLVNRLCQQLTAIDKYIQFEIERTIFDFCGKLDLNVLLNLTAFYIGLIDLEPVTDNSKATFFIYKCLYYLINRATPLIYCMLVAHPMLLPTAKEMEMVKDPLMRTLVALITNTPYNVTGKADVGYKKQEMFITLKTRYGYFANLSFSIENAMEYCIKCFQSDCFQNADYSLILISKRKGCDWAIKNIIDAHLLPLLHQLMTTQIAVSTGSDKKVASILFTIASIIKTYPLNESIEFYINIFVSCLNATDRKIIQEAAVSALCQLVRFGVTQIYRAICNWRPTYDVSPHILAMLNSFIHRKEKSFWFSK